MGRGGREWQGCVRNASRLTFGKSKVETRRGSVDLALALVFKAYVCYVFCNQMWLVVWGEFIHRFGRRMNNEFKVKSPALIGHDSTLQSTIYKKLKSRGKP